MSPLLYYGKIQWFNSGLSGLLIFHENKSVEIVSLGGGYFDTSSIKALSFL
jgi:hypothetical protein